MVVFNWLDTKVLKRMVYSTALKLKAIRKAERLTKHELAVLGGVPVDVYTLYEQGEDPPDFAVVSKIASHPRLRKYCDWLMFSEVSAAIGPIDLNLERCVHCENIPFRLCKNQWLCLRSLQINLDSYVKVYHFDHNLMTVGWLCNGD